MMDKKTVCAQKKYFDPQEGGNKLKVEKMAR